MTKATIYRIRNHDGGLPGVTLPPERGLLELTDAEWRLHFRHLETAIACGLLRSRIDIGPLGHRHCLITLTGDEDAPFTVHLVVQARVRKVRTDLEQRCERLVALHDAVAAAGRGEWWRDNRVFEHFGPLGTRSVTGVRYLDGLARTAKVKSTRIGQVLDLGPRGVTLRGWRTHLTIDWEQVDAIEVEHPSVIRVRLRDDSEVRLSAPGWSDEALRTQLEPVVASLPPARAARTGA